MMTHHHHRRRLDHGTGHRRDQRGRGSIDHHQRFCPSCTRSDDDDKTVVLPLPPPPVRVVGVGTPIRLPVEEAQVVGGSFREIINNKVVHNSEVIICNNHDDDDGDNDDDENKSDRRKNGSTTIIVEEKGNDFCVSSRRCCCHRRRRRRRYNCFIHCSSASSRSGTTSNGGSSSLFFVPVATTAITRTTAAVMMFMILVMMIMILSVSTTATTTRIVLSEAEAFTSQYDYHSSYHHKTRHTQPGWSLQSSTTVIIASRNNNNNNRYSYSYSSCTRRRIIAQQEYGNVATTKTTLQSSSSSLSATSIQSTTLSTDAPSGADTVVELEWTELFSPKQEMTTTTKTTTTPVVFLHGLLGSKRNFASLATMLGVQLQTPRTIYGVDLRNHGDNKESNHVLDDGCMLYPHMARDVVRFLDSQKIEKCIVVGHSMGGKVGQALALLYPERVEGLVVIDIAPVTYTRTNNPNWKAVEDILIALKETTATPTAAIATAAATTTSSSSESSNGDGGGGGGGGGGLTKQQVDKALRPAVPDPALRAFVLTNYDSQRCMWKIPITTLVRELENIAGFDLSDTATTTGGTNRKNNQHHHQYDGDVFIIHGGQSKFVRHAYMDTIAQFFPNHLLTTIRGAGHWVHAEAPDDTVALLKRFLDR